MTFCYGRFYRQKSFFRIFNCALCMQSWSFMSLYADSENKPMNWAGQCCSWQIVEVVRRRLWIELGRFCIILLHWWESGRNSVSETLYCGNLVFSIVLDFVDLFLCIKMTNGKTRISRWHMGKQGVLYWDLVSDQVGWVVSIQEITIWILYLPGLLRAVVICWILSIAYRMLSMGGFEVNIALILTLRTLCSSLVSKSRKTMWQKEFWQVNFRDGKLCRKVSILCSKSI